MKCLILGAFLEEIRSLISYYGVSKHPDLPNVWMKESDGHTLYLGISGVGPKKVRRFLKNVYTGIQPDRVILCGIVGACSPDLKTGQLVFPRQILFSDSRKPFEWMIAPEIKGFSHFSGTHYSSARFISKAEKARLLSDQGVLTVDMELCELLKNQTIERNKLFFLKAVGDDSSAQEPPFWILCESFSKFPIRKIFQKLREVPLKTLRDLYYALLFTWKMQLGIKSSQKMTKKLWEKLRAL